tara:strand:+ start:3451 stop:4017 length:567 start_codon:yes stop_codon:yes gene_type:complete
MNFEYFLIDEDGSSPCHEECEGRSGIDGYADEFICCRFYADCEKREFFNRILCYNLNGIDNPCAYKLDKNEINEYNKSSVNKLPEDVEYYKAYPIKINYIIPNKVLKEHNILQDSNLNGYLERLKNMDEKVIMKYKLEKPVYDFDNELRKIHDIYKDDPDAEFETAEGIIGVCDNCHRTKYTILSPGD